MKAPAVVESVLPDIHMPTLPLSTLTASLLDLRQQCRRSGIEISISDSREALLLRLQQPRVAAPGYPMADVVAPRNVGMAQLVKENEALRAENAWLRQWRAGASPAPEPEPAPAAAVAAAAVAVPSEAVPSEAAPEPPAPATAPVPAAEAQPVPTLSIVLDRATALANAAAAEAKPGAEPAEAAAGGGSEEEEEEEGEVWRARTWLDSMPLSELVAEALLAPAAARAPDKAAAAAALRALELPYVKALGEAGSVALLEELLGAAVPRVAAALHEGARALSAAAAATGDDLHSKFAAVAQFTMSYRGLDAYFAGLDASIGPPSPNLPEAMAFEHCRCADSDGQFETSNYGVSTTSHIEYLFVTDAADEVPRAAHAASMRDLSKAATCAAAAAATHAARRAWPEESKLRDRDARHEMRRPKPLRAFDAARRGVDARLRRLGVRPLFEDELVGARLYTGPMFLKYNLVLRGGVPGAAPFFAAQFERLTRGNRSTVTVAVLPGADRAWWRHSWPPRSPQTACEGLRLLFSHTPPESTFSLRLTIQATGTRRRSTSSTRRSCGSRS